MVKLGRGQILLVKEVIGTSSSVDDVLRLYLHCMLFLVFRSSIHEGQVNLVDSVTNQKHQIMTSSRADYEVLCLLHLQVVVQCHRSSR